MRSRTYQNSYAGLVALSNQPAAWVWAAIGILVLALMPTLFGSFGLNMLTAIFVAFKPQWLLTYSDERYLPRDNRPL